MESGDCNLLVFFEDLDQLVDLNSGVRCLLVACNLQVWSNYVAMSGETGDCYLLVLCRYGAMV